MKFESSLEQGRFLKRYKRFFADIEWNGKTITAHVPNTGSMKSCSEPDSPCLFSISKNLERKLPYTLEMIQTKAGTWVGVNTSQPNKLVKEALQFEHFDWWKGYEEIKPEFKISAESRLDFALLKSGTEKKHFIEVKNVSLVENSIAKFPDAVSERGQKHLRDLMKLKEEGHSVEIVFTIQRSDATQFAPADEIDPEYGRLLRQAIKAGVRVTPVVVLLSSTEMKLSKQLLPVLTSPNANL